MQHTVIFQLIVMIFMSDSVELLEINIQYIHQNLG